jgi:hypothetical protein
MLCDLDSRACEPAPLSQPCKQCRLIIPTRYASIDYSCLQSSEPGNRVRVFMEMMTGLSSKAKAA